MQGPRIKIVRTAGGGEEDALNTNIKYLRELGLDVSYQPTLRDELWPYCAGSAEARADQLSAALLDKNTNVVWAARGGYGCSDFLHLLNWSKLQKLFGNNLQRKIFVGFSDNCALHSAFYARLGWVGIHGPMPATKLWINGGKDIEALLNALKSGRFRSQFNICRSSRGAKVKSKSKSTIVGKTFGGCMSVLTNLIGTPYFPKSLRGHIVFFEEIDENQGRIARFLSQWHLSGALRGVKAIVLGDFRNCGSLTASEWADFFEFRTGIPTFFSNEFGHITPNQFVPIGARAKIDAERFDCSFSANGFNETKKEI